MTPEPTSDKEVETEEVETEETNIPTSKYFTEGYKSTGLQVEVCSTYNTQLYVCALVCTSLTFTMYNCITHRHTHS